VLSIREHELTLLAKAGASEGNPRMFLQGAVLEHKWHDRVLTPKRATVAAPVVI
jgi:hypothetical protein